RQYVLESALDVWIADRGSLFFMGRMVGFAEAVVVVSSLGALVGCWRSAALPVDASAGTGGSGGRAVGARAQGSDARDAPALTDADALPPADDAGDCHAAYPDVCMASSGSCYPATPTPQLVARHVPGIVPAPYPPPIYSPRPVSDSPQFLT